MPTLFPITACLKNRLLKVWPFVMLFSMLFVQLDCQAADESITEEQRRSAAVALNYSRASLHRIRRNTSVRVLLEEQEKILNLLDLNGVADEEVMKLYSSLLDEISQIQIADRDRVVLQEKYSRMFQHELGVNTFEIAAQVASAQYVSAVRTGANSWWDYRLLQANQDLDVWQVDKKRMTSVVEKSSLFLDTSWKMARCKKISDRWLVRGDDLDKLELALREQDPAVRMRVLKRMEGFMECYPPYWYYVARTQQSAGQLLAACETYDKLVAIGSGHFRKDEMLAAGLANRSLIQSFLSQPAAADTARKAMSFSSEAWEANLICASVLQKAGKFDAAEDAILRNLDVNLERAQSRRALLGLYYASNNKTKMAELLQDPELIKDIPAKQLLMCVEKLGPNAVPTTVRDFLSTSIQVTPRLNIGRDDFVVAVGPAWKLHNAVVTLHWGDRTFSNPRETSSREGVLYSFDGIAEFGNLLSFHRDKKDVSLTIQYPNDPPFKLALKPDEDSAKLVDLSNIKFVGRHHPVYRPAMLEHNGLRLSLRLSGSPTELSDLALPVSRTTAKPPYATNEDVMSDEPTVVKSQYSDK